jgi:hypothetical protein
MRVVFPLLAACAVLSACSSKPPVQSGPPSISYQVNSDDLAPANVQAQNFCRQYGHAAQFQGFKSTTAGNTAVYTCDGPVPGPSSGKPSSLSGSTGAPPPPAAAPGPPTSLSPPTQ